MTVQSHACLCRRNPTCSIGHTFNRTVLMTAAFTLNLFMVFSSCFYSGAWCLLCVLLVGSSIHHSSHSFTLFCFRPSQKMGPSSSESPALIGSGSPVYQVGSLIALPGTAGHWRWGLLCALLYHWAPPLFLFASHLRTIWKNSLLIHIGCSPLCLTLESHILSLSYTWVVTALFNSSPFFYSLFSLFYEPRSFNPMTVFLDCNTVGLCFPKCEYFY